MADATLKMVLLGQDRGASRAIKGVGDQADKTERHTSRLGSSFAKAGKMAALGLAAGIGIATVAMVSMVKNAAEDQAAQKRLATALKNTTGATNEQVKSVENWITKQGVALGVTDDELRPALGKLVTATHSVSKAQRLASLAMNVSAGTGKSLESVSMALSKAYNGNTGGLGKLGIAVKDASGKTLTFDQITKNLAGTFKGQASAHAATFQGKMERLKLVFDETKETIGGKLIPVLTKVAGWFLNLVKGMQAGTGAGGSFKKIMDGVGNVIRPIGNFIGHELVPFIKDLAKRFSEAMGGTAGFKKSMHDLQPFLEVVGRVLKVLWEGLKFAIKALLPGAVAQFKLLTQSLGIVGKIAIWLWNNAFAPAMKGIVTGIGWVMQAIGKMLSALGNIKGFGWAKDAGDKLQHAADSAFRLAAGIKKIPNKKTVTVTYNENHHVTRSGAIGGPGHATAQAVGSRFVSGGMTMVGERGPELLDLGRGGRMFNAQESARMMKGNAGSVDPGYVVVVVQDPSGKVIEEKLAKVRRDRGGQPLAFQR